MTDPTAHHLGAATIHTVWDHDLPPALSVRPGEVVVFDTLDASHGGVARRVQAGEQVDLPDDLRALIVQGAYPERPGPRGHPLTGPVQVAGARPGDLLVIDILAVQTGAWGWTACRPDGIGLLDADLAARGLLTGAHLHLWDLRGGSHAVFKPGIRVPLAPFCGVMGLAPAEPGAHPTSPPRRVGGNMDVRQLVAGSTLYLPVEVEGALLSVGDVHAAQGDGEVSGTGIETEGKVTLRLSLLPGAATENPAFRTHTAGGQSRTWHATTGHAPDLMEAARQALRGTLAHLTREHGLSAPDAYILASACVDLKISQIVDAPNYTVSAFLPLDIFD